MKASVMLANTIVEAARLRENSFKHDVAAKAQAAGKKTDFTELYGLSVYAAADQAAAGNGLEHPTYLLLTHCWNEAVDWATDNCLIG